MDGARFDLVARVLASPGSRRGMLHRSAALPLAAMLSPVLGDDSEAARRRRDAQRRREQVQDERKKKKKKKNKNKNKGQDTPPPSSPPPPAPPCTVCAAGCAFTSVQDAINAASAGATISLCAGIYEGSIAIDRDLTLVGAGQGGVGQTRLEGTAGNRVVSVAAGRTVTLRNLRITGGAGEFGSGILNEGQLTLVDCTVTRNYGGGGIYNMGDATLALTGCTVSANTTTGAGGGIYSLGTCTIEASSITGNSAAVWGGGLQNDRSLYFDAAVMTLTNTTVSGNIADYGGGIDNHYTLTLNASTVEGNTARVQGGGLDNWSGTATLNDSTVARNSAPTGGGIFVRVGEVTLDASQVNMNTAEGDGVSGGGIMNQGGTVNVTKGSSVQENTADFGAGISSGVGSTVTLTDSDVTANIATRLGGGIYNSGTVNLVRGSITSNEAGDPSPSGGGVINDGQVNFTTGFDISGNTPDQCFNNLGNGCPL